MVVYRWFVGDESCICLNQDVQDLRMYRMGIFRWFINIQKQSLNSIIKKSQLPKKQSFKNILKIPTFQQTIIQQHPENP
jgi:hypothetical protein